MNKLISEINTNPTRDAITATIEALLIMEAKSATKFISPTLTIRASQKLYHGKLPPKNATSLDIVLTIGRPNFEARQFIKKCQKFGEPFPVRKIQLKFPSKSKVIRKRQ